MVRRRVPPKPASSAPTRLTPPCTPAVVGPSSASADGSRPPLTSSRLWRDGPLTIEQHRCGTLNVPVKKSRPANSTRTTDYFYVRFPDNPYPRRRPRAFDGLLTAPLELGRQQAREPAPYAVLAGVETAPARLVVARQDDRDNILHDVLPFLEPLPSGRVPSHQPEQGAPLPCGGGAEAWRPRTQRSRRRTGRAPFSFALPGRAVTVGASDSDGQAGMHSLDEQTVGPGRIADLSVRLRSLPGLSGAQLTEMVGWLQTTMGVLQATVGAADFMDKAAEALVQIVGLGWVGCYCSTVNSGSPPPPTARRRHSVGRGSRAAGCLRRYGRKDLLAVRPPFRRRRYAEPGAPSNSRGRAPP